MNPNRRVVVTGMGLATALGLGVGGNWRKLLAGVSGIERPGVAGAAESPIQAVGAVKADDWTTICRTFPDMVRAGADRRTLFALWAARSALIDAGFPSAIAPPERCAGVLLSVGLGETRLEDMGDDSNTGLQLTNDLGRRIHPQSGIRTSHDRPAGLIAHRYGLKGPNATVTSACAAGTQAIGLAYRRIQRGEADLMVAGGTESMINPVGLIFFVLLQAAAVSKSDPQTMCRPFDRKRTGLVMGEGAGIVILECLDRAIKRGAPIHAEIRGYGSSLDAWQITAPHPRGRGAAQAMLAALEDAGLQPQTIDYINAHGTGTRLNDIAETRAIKAVFGTHAPKIAINSSKSMIGHLLAASGGPELIYTVLSVARQKVHPTINLKHPDPQCDLDYVPGTRRSWPIRAALSNSFGFGGQNATVVVQPYDPHSEDKLK